MARGSIKGITFEIGGDTTKLNKALKDVDGQLKSTQGNLRDVERALKMDPGNTDLIKQKQRLLGEEISKTKEKLDILKQADKTAKQQLANGEIGQDDYEALQREIAKTEANLKSYQKQLDNIPGTLDKVSSKMESAGGKMSSVGEGLTKGVTVPIAAVGAASAAAFNEVDEALDTIIKKTGATGEAAEDMNNVFHSVYTSMPVDAQNAGDAIGELNTQFALTGDALQDATEYMLKFAEINEADVTASTQGAKGAIEAYELSANDLNSVLDAVTSTSQKTGVSTDDLFKSVTKGAPSLKEMGLNFAESTQLIGQFEQSGLDADKAISYLSKAQVNFAKDGKTMQQGLSELQTVLTGSASETDKLTAASEIFGTKGAVFMLDAIERGQLDFSGLAESASNASGVVSTTFEGTLDPIDKAKLALNNLKDTGAELFTTIQEVAAPILETVVTKLQEFSQWFRSLSPETQQMIVKIGLMAAAIGPLLVVGGKLLIGASKVIGAVSKIKTAVSGLSAGVGLLSSGALLPIIAVVGAVVAAGVLLYKNWDKIKEAAGKLGENIKEKWNGLKAKTKETWENVKTTVSDKMKEASENTKRELGAMKKSYDENGGGIKGIAAGMMTGVKLRFESGYKTLNTLTGGKLGELATKFKTKFGEIQTRGSDIMEGLKTTVGKGIERVKSFFNFNWSLPKIKMPHFSISGGFSLNPPSIPHFNVDWYDKGGIFSSPSVIGVGEKRPEFVGALDDLRTIVREESANAVSAQVLEIMEQMLAIMSGTLPEIANKGLSINEKSITRSAERGITQRQITNARARGKYV